MSPRPQIGCSRKRSLSIFLKSRLRDRLSVLRRILSLARRGAHYPEVFHHLRVSIRRFRVAERIVEEQAAEPGMPHLGRALRRVADRGGRIRDDDVMAIALRERLRAAPSLAPAIQPLLTRLADRRPRRLARLDRTLRTWGPEGRRGKVVRELASALRGGTTRGAPARGNAIVLQRLASTPGNCFLHSAARLRSTRPGLAALHKIRIAGKHLRYTLEFIEPGLPPSLSRPAHDALKALVALQRALGDIQDRRVRLDWICRRAAKATTHADPQAPALRRLATLERAGLHAAVAECTAEWKNAAAGVSRALSQAVRTRIPRSRKNHSP